MHSLTHFPCPFPCCLSAPSIPWPFPVSPPVEPRIPDGGGKTEEWKGKETVSEEKCACAHDGQYR